MFNLSVKETEYIDFKLSPKLDMAAKGQVMAEQLALDATRLLSCTEDRLSEYKDKNFFQRCWCKLSGKSESVQNATQKDLIEMQKYAWRYINLLQERDLMLADTMISVKNNLITLSVEQDEVKKQVNRLADKVYNRFVALEKRVDNIEISQRLHSWILTLDTYDYEELYPTYIRLLRVIKDFYEIKSDNWSIQELKYLQKALKESGIQPKEQIVISDFISLIIDEIGDYYSDFDRFLSLNVDSQRALVIEDVSSPTFIALYQVKENYLDKSKTIKILSKKLKISEKEAIKEVLLANIIDLGLDIHASLPIKDLAIEILCCLRIMSKLHQEDTHILMDGLENEQIDAVGENEQVAVDSEAEQVDADKGVESKFFAINEQEISEELILDLVNNKINFRVFNITDITATVDFLEKTIESQKFSVRVYTENRSAVLAGGLIPTGFTQLAALGAGIGFALHNLATYNPDFEIGKSIGHDRITVTYKKSS